MTTHQVDLVVPDLGVFSDVDVIEVLVEPGDAVAIEESLITLETDKASMDVPATHAGKIISLMMKVGDKVNAGDVILALETTEVGEPDATVMLAPGDQQKILAAAAAEAAGQEAVKEAIEEAVANGKEVIGKQVEDLKVGGKEAVEKAKQMAAEAA